MKANRVLAAATLAVAALLSVPDAPALAAGPFFFEGDMVRGRTQDGASGPTCVLTSEFKRKEPVVWRLRIRDAKGEPVDQKGMKTVAIALPDGKTFDMKFGPHPRGKTDDYFWTTSWEIPADYPTGTIGFKVVATDLDGKTHEWKPFNVELSWLKIIPGDVTFTK